MNIFLSQQQPPQYGEAGDEEKKRKNDPENKKLVSNLLIRLDPTLEGKGTSREEDRCILIFILPSLSESKTTHKKKIIFFFSGLKLFR